MSLVDSFVQYWDEDHGETVPTKKEVCWRCQGEGVHDAWEGGMTSSEMDDMGDDFMDDYRAGNYNVACSECGGNNVTTEVDIVLMSKEQLDSWYEWIESEGESRAIAAQERAMGA